MFQTVQMFAELIQIPNRRARRASDARLRRFRKRHAAKLRVEPLEDRAVPAAYYAGNAAQLASDLATAPITFPGLLRLVQIAPKQQGDTTSVYITGEGVIYNLGHRRIKFSHDQSGSGRVVQLNIVKARAQSHPRKDSLVLAFYASCYIDENSSLVEIEPGESVKFTNLTIAQARRLVARLPGVIWATRRV